MASLPSGDGRLKLVQTVAETDLGCQVKYRPFDPEIDPLRHVGH